MARSQRNRVILERSAKPGSVEDYPFGEEVAVFKVAGKMSAPVSQGAPPGSVSLKCDPELAADLRARYAAITAGYHLSKRHWNTITLDGSVPADELLDLIDHSYELIVGGLTKEVLVLYRLTFGQPCHEDMLELLRRGVAKQPHNPGAWPQSHTIDRPGSLM